MTVTVMIMPRTGPGRHRDGDSDRRTVTVPGPVRCRPGDGCTPALSLSLGCGRRGSLRLPAAEAGGSAVGARRAGRRGTVPGPAWDSDGARPGPGPGLDSEKTVPGPGTRRNTVTQAGRGPHRPGPRGGRAGPAPAGPSPVLSRPSSPALRLAVGRLRLAGSESGAPALRLAVAE